MIGVVHSSEPNFKLDCGIEGCTRSYDNYYSYRKHLRKKHLFVLEPQSAAEQDDPTSI